MDNPPFIFHIQQTQHRKWEQRRQHLLEQALSSMQADRRSVLGHYQWQDLAVKVVGVGSVGTRCLVSLLLAEEDDPLLIQFKEARRSVLETPKGESRFENQGERVVTGQRLMQAASDIFLAWFRVPGGHDYYVRQLRDMKASVEIEAMNPRLLGVYASLCGWALARAHAKAGDAAAIAGYVGKGDHLDEALVLYAKAYADQVERDFAAFQKAVRAGKLKTDIDEKGSLDFTL